MESIVTILIFITFILRFENLRNIKYVNLMWPNYIKTNFKFNMDHNSPQLKPIWIHWKFNFYSLVILLISNFMTNDMYTQLGILLCVLIDITTSYTNKRRKKGYKIRNKVESIAYVMISIFLLLHRTLLFLPQPDNLNV
jgi:hypothetical protein